MRNKLLSLTLDKFSSKDVGLRKRLISCNCMVLKGDVLKCIAVHTF